MNRLPSISMTSRRPSAVAAMARVYWDVAAVLLEAWVDGLGRRVGQVDRGRYGDARTQHSCDEHGKKDEDSNEFHAASLPCPALSPPARLVASLGRPYETRQP